MSVTSKAAGGGGSCDHIATAGLIANSFKQAGDKMATGTGTGTTSSGPTRELLAYSTSNNSASNNSCSSSTANQQQLLLLQQQSGQHQQMQQQMQHRAGLIQLSQATGGSTPSKIVRILTVLAYMVAVSMAAILLSIYYTFIWNPYDLRPLGQQQQHPISVQDSADTHQHYQNDPANSGGNSTTFEAFDLLTSLRVLPNRSSKVSAAAADSNGVDSSAGGGDVFVVVDDATDGSSSSNSPVDVFYPLSSSSSSSSSTTADQDQIVSYTSYTSSSSSYPSTSRKPPVTARLKGSGDRVARLVMSRGARSADPTPKRTFTSAAAASFTVQPSSPSTSGGSLPFKHNATSQR